MSADRGYLLSPLAAADLEEIWLYTCRTWSLEQADSYHGSLVAAFEGLAAGHKKGRSVDIREGYFRYAVGAHLIFYRMTGTRIDVIRVLHQRMDASRRL